ncbi:MAG: glycosyl hydrolase family 28-related protein [Planctomycetota bacterium]|jgi:hypothetical protein|nr:glycosyl hydrolase family 28-related protein [Planctomycetota bacterium]
MLKRLVILMVATTALLAAQDIRFPADAGVIDVTADPYLADPTGATDSTAAIQQALSDHPSQNRIIYLPKGTYLISDTLRWPAGKGEGGTAKRTILQGESRTETVIKLQDACEGFTTGGMVNKQYKKNHRPDGKAMVWTGKAPAQRFRNAIRNLTLDVGAGNPGAIGARFNTSNQGTVYNVTIRAGADSGRIGLDIGYTGEIGPMLIHDLVVEGFDIGVHSWGSVNSITVSSVTVSGQRTVGIMNNEQVLSIESLRSVNSVPALHNTNGGGVVTLLAADCRSEDESAASAIVNQGILYVRQLETAGYTNAIDNRVGDKGQVAAGSVSEFTSHAATKDPLFPDRTPVALGLPIEPVPAIAWDPIDTWVSPLGFGGKGNDKEDDTAAIQAAIDSGATTVYLPNGTWTLSGTLVLRGKVRRLIGCEARLEGESIIELGDGDAPVVAIERFEFAPIHGPGPAIRHASKRTLVLSNMRMRRQGYAYDAAEGAGDVFFQDVAGDNYRFVAGQRVWGRQMNPESDTPMIENHGADVWILGLKTENDGPALRAVGGRTELCGAFIYANSRREKSPLFILEQGAQFSVTMGEASFRKLPFKQLVVQGDVVVKAGETPKRGEGSSIALFRAWGK